MLQEIGRYSHLSTDDSDDVCIVGGTLQAVVLPSGRGHVGLSGNGDIEVCPHGSLLRQSTMISMELNAVDNYLKTVYFHLFTFSPFKLYNNNELKRMHETLRMNI